MRCRLIVAMVALGCLGLIAWAVWPIPPTPPSWAMEYDVTARKPESIAPGTVVGLTVPEGWSHLIIKSLPRIRPSEIENIPRNPLVERSRTVRMASWMFAAFVADVGAERQGDTSRYRIRAIGLGLGTSIGGRDVVITPETAAQYGIELDWITRDILTKGYKTQSLARVVVHGPTMAVVDTPVWYRSDGRHRLLRFRYALLVDSFTGSLDTLVWLLDADGRCGDGTATLLGPNTIDEAELRPDPNEFNLVGKPSEAAFAVDRLPRGLARLMLPSDLRSLASQSKYTPAEAGLLEQQLRQLLAKLP
jgi:hypothetical protein